MTDCILCAAFRDLKELGDPLGDAPDQCSSCSSIWMAIY